MSIAPCLPLLAQRLARLRQFGAVDDLRGAQVAQAVGVLRAAGGSGHVVAEVGQDRDGDRHARHRVLRQRDDRDRLRGYGRRRAELEELRLQCWEAAAAAIMVLALTAEPSPSRCERRDG